MSKIIMMKYFRKEFIILTLSLSSLIIGCGEINEGVGKNPDVFDRAFSGADCELNTDRLGDILKEPITEEINCAYSMLNMLINIVPPERKDLGEGNLSRTTLEKFIKHKFPEAIDVLDYLEVFFVLNSFVFGTDPDLIIEEDFRRLKDLLIVFNKEISGVYKHLEKLGTDDKISIRFHRSIKEKEILRAARVIISDARNEKDENISLLGLLSLRKDHQRSINLANLFDYFRNDDNESSIEKIKKLIFAKKIFLGGEANTLLHSEFLSFLSKNFIELVDSAYDIYRHKNLSFDDESKRYDLYIQNLERIENLIFTGFKDAPIFTFNNIFDALKAFEGDIFGDNSDLKFHGFSWELGRLKEILLGNNKYSFNAGDLFKVVAEFKEIAKIGHDFALVFKRNLEYIVGAKDKIENSDEIVIPSGLDPKYVELFKHVLVTYRYYKGSDVLPYFGNDFNRNIKGMTLMGQFEYIADKLFRFYESAHPCNEKLVYNLYNSDTGEYEPFQLHDDHRCKGTEDFDGTLNVGQLYIAVLELKKVLYETKIVLRTREDKAAENALTVPDLFLYTANDDGLLDKHEFISFVMKLFTGTSMMDNITDFIKRKCGTVGYRSDLGGDLYESSCMRENFFSTLIEKFRSDDVPGDFAYFDYLPKLKSLYEDLKRSGDEDALERYVLLLEKYTKICAPYDNIPYGKSDLLALYAGMFSVEETIAKFDTNKNNILDSDENHETYRHFKRGLESFMPDYLRFASKTVFKYLVKYREMPALTWSVIPRLIGTIGPMPRADRETIMAVLVTLQSQGDKKREARLGDAFQSTPDYCKEKYGVSELIKDEWDHHF